MLLFTKPTQKSFTYIYWVGQLKRGKHEMRNCRYFGFSRHTQETETMTQRKLRSHAVEVLTIGPIL